MGTGRQDKMSPNLKPATKLSIDFSDDLALEKFRLKKWEKSFQSFAKAGRLTAMLVLQDSKKSSIGPFYGNNLGKFLFENNIMGRPAAKGPIKKLTKRVLEDGHPQEIILFEFLRIACYPLSIEGRPIGYALFGFAIDRFVSPYQCRNMQKELDVPYHGLWNAIRSDAPLSDERFISVGELATNLSTQIIEEWALSIKLQSALKAKDLFISSVTHELRTPLQALLLHTEVLEAENPENLESISGIKENVNHLDRLINQLFDYARLFKNKVSLQYSIENIENLIKTSVLPYKAQAKNEEKYLEVNNHTSEGQTIELDKLRFTQVIGNLVSNALKFTDPGDQIKVVTTIKKNMLEVLVTDTGEGIDENELQEVHKKFTQEERLKVKSTGLGLGLSISKEILELHGGELAILSDGKRKGTTVVSRWPLGPNRKSLT